jgi:hypothetical protein
MTILKSDYKLNCKIGDAVFVSYKNSQKIEIVQSIFPNFIISGRYDSRTIIINEIKQSLTSLLLKLIAYNSIDIKDKSRFNNLINSMVFVSGPAGSTKTQTLIKSLHDGDVVITQSSKNKTRLINKIQNNNVIVLTSEYFYSKYNGRINNLFIDECELVDMLAVLKAYQLNAIRVTCYGDSLQVGKFLSSQQPGYHVLQNISDYCKTKVMFDTLYRGNIALFKFVSHQYKKLGLYIKFARSRENGIVNMKQVDFINKDVIYDYIN